VIETRQRPRAQLHRLADRVLVAAYRTSGGRIPATAQSIPVLLLTTTGRRTGIPRTHPVAFGRDRGNLVVIGSNRGNDAVPAWVANLRADPAARIELGSDIQQVISIPALGAERDRLWQLMSARYPTYLTYHSTTTRVFPIFALMPIR